ILGFRADIRKWQALVFIVFRAGWSIPFVALGTIEILIEIEKSQQLVLSFEPGVLAIQSNKITGGAVSLFLDEANVVLLLELEHFIFGIPQFLFSLDELFEFQKQNNIG